VVLVIMQTSTMALIGLWHGGTWNFLIWGLWHGLGLFVQNRYSEWVAPKLGNLESHPWKRRFMNGIGVFFTFHYVALGWVWFALPDPGLSLRIFSRLFGG
jgi:alginate O-acetyltransferase complex protein AlgI